jgi:hypothetical protein
MKIYCVHPISGASAEEIFKYYDQTKDILIKLGYDVFTPMYGKEYLRNEIKFKAEGYTNPLSTNHSIFNRDKWMCLQADIIYASFIGTKIVSIGSMFELAWANIHNKQIVIAMEQDNIHRHAFVLEAATIIYPTEDEAINYLTKIIKKEN